MAAPDPYQFYPRQNFQLNTVLAGEFNKMVVSDAFQEAGNYALLEYWRKQVGSKDPIAAYHRLDGALQFLNVLKKVAMKADLPPVKSPDENVNQNA